MEEKGTDTNKNKSTNKSNYSSLYLFDDAYHKVKAQQKSIRCKSANIHKKFFFNTNLKENLRKKKEENKKDNMSNFRRHNFFSNGLKKEKSNKNDLHLFSVKSRNKLYSNIKTINLSNLNLIKSNDSMKLDSTKQTSKRTRILSGKYNASYSFNKLSNSTRKDNRRIFKLRNNNKNNFSIININADSCDKKETNINKTTLKDLTIQKLIKRSKTIEFDKILKSNRNKTNKESVKYLDFYSSPITYYLKKEKKYNIEKKFRRNNDECKEADMNTINNYPIKYSFMDDTMNNIFHMVNFVDMQNKEELFQNVIIDFKNKNEIKFEDFKTYGYEFSPEILYKINQDEKQKLIKMKLEEFKKKNTLESSNEINPKKLQRPKFKKNYIPEFKLKFKNPDWNKRQYESIYKFHAIKYTLTPKKNSMLRNRVIKNNNIISRNSLKHKSMISYSKKGNYLENINKERKNEKKSKSFRIDMIENKELKSVLKNNENSLNNNYSIISEEEKNEKITEEISKNDINNNKIKNIQMNNNNDNTNNINNDNNKDEKKDSSSNIKTSEIKSSKNEQNDNTSNKINLSTPENSSSNNNIDFQKYYKIINQKKSLKDYNKINKVVKVENLFLKGGENKYEHLDISEYVNRINSTRRYQKRNSFNFFRENDYITSTKNITRKSITNITTFPRKKHKTLIQRKSAKITFSKLFNEKDNFFKLNEERQTNINFNKQPEKTEEVKKNKEENDLISLLNIKDNIEETKIEVEEKKNESNIVEEKNEIEEEKNDEYTQKNILEKIENENKHHEEHKRKYVPFYQSQREISKDYNKIEINFISNKSKFVKRRLKTKSRKNVKEGIIERLKPKKEEIIKKQVSNNEKEEEEEDTVKKLEERLSIIKGRRMNKSATLDYINQKYKEIESQKDKVDINEEITENLDKLKFFKNVDLESIEDIEYNKNVLLYKLREDIKYKISIGTCDKTELDEYFKFESRLNEYKVNYNLKDKDKIREYVLLLLVKFNEFMELLSIRESRKNEENRINKFVNNLNYELDYNIPMLLMAKGRKCHSRNYEGYVPSLSELKK